jgi:uncharacterized protein
VVWANVGPGIDGNVTPYRSSWTWAGEPLPFVAYDENWQPAQADGPIAYRSLYEQSLARDPIGADAAAIPIEEAKGDLVLVAGHDDKLWPSVSSARALARRRAANDRQVEVILNERAGHSPLWPGQAVPPPSPRLERGGTPSGDAELGSATWSAINQRLRLN